MALFDDLFAIHNSVVEKPGTETYIMSAGRYFKGHGYTWTAYAEDAFIFPSRKVAEKIIRKYPDTFKEATVHERYVDVAASS